MKLSVCSIIWFSLIMCGGCSNRGRNYDAKSESVARWETSGNTEAAKLARLQDVMTAVKSLHKPLGDPQPGDWLTMYEERGQTFNEYLVSNPVSVRGERRIIYVQPLGQFTMEQRRIVTLTADYMERFFGLPVRVNEDLPLPRIPAAARRLPLNMVIARKRKNYPEGTEQILTGFILNDILRPRLPPDAAALIAFTASDLYPEESWNYVFGQASLRERVGVWSLHRFGDSSASADGFRQSLLRTMKLATHETGHIFSIPHCTQYECNMNGTNSIAETDRRPPDVCPECMAKIVWASDYEPRLRYERLAAFCREHGLATERELFEGYLAKTSGQPHIQ